MVEGAGGAGSPGRGLMEAIELARSGDEIISCGRLFHTGAPVRTWLDADGYDGASTPS